MYLTFLSVLSVVYFSKVSLLDLLDAFVWCNLSLLVWSLEIRITILKRVHNIYAENYKKLIAKQKKLIDCLMPYYHEKKDAQS